MKTGETIRLGILLMLIAVSLGGCLDYRAGRHWVAVGVREWVRVDKPVTLHGSTFESPYMVWAQQTCSSTVTVEIQKSAEGSTHSLFLVPILPGDSVGNPAKTSIVVRGPGLSAGCWLLEWKRTSHFDRSEWDGGARCTGVVVQEIGGLLLCGRSSQP